MSGSSVESVWIPNYDTGSRLGDQPRKSSGGLRLADRHQLPEVTISRASKSKITAKQRRYITFASSGLNFDDTVVRERCFQVDPFTSPLTTTFRDRRSSCTRCRNDISYLSKPVDPLLYLKRVKPAKPGSANSESVFDRSATATKSWDADVPRSDSDEQSVQLTESYSSSNVPLAEQENSVEWDECLLKKLSANTARWLAQNHATTEDARNRLHQFLDAVHGRATADNQVELFEESHGATDAVAAAKTMEKPWISGKDM